MYMHATKFDFTCVCDVHVNVHYRAVRKVAWVMSGA